MLSTLASIIAVPPLAGDPSTLFYYESRFYAKPRRARRNRLRPPHHARPAVPFEASVDAPFDLEFDRADSRYEIATPLPGAGETLHLPVIPLRDMVIFPHMVTQFFVGRELSLQAVAEAVARDQRILAVAQREPDVEEVAPTDLYPIGVELAIGRVLKMPDGTTAVL